MQFELNTPVKSVFRTVNRKENYQYCKKYLQFKKKMFSVYCSINFHHFWKTDFTGVFNYSRRFSFLKILYYRGCRIIRTDCIKNDWNNSLRSGRRRAFEWLHDRNILLNQSVEEKKNTAPHYYLFNESVILSSERVVMFQPGK